MAAISSKKHVSEISEAFSPCKAIKRAKNDTASCCLKVKPDWANMIVQLWTEVSVYLIDRKTTLSHKELVPVMAVSPLWKNPIARSLSRTILRAIEPYQNHLKQIESSGDADSQNKARTTQEKIWGLLKEHGIFLSSKPFRLISLREVSGLNGAIAGVWNIATESDARNRLRAFSAQRLSAKSLIPLEYLLIEIKKRHPSVVSVNRISKILFANPSALDVISRAKCLDIEENGKTVFDVMAEQNFQPVLDVLHAEETFDWMVVASSSSSTAAAENS